jgi:hypothetical protein
LVMGGLEVEGLISVSVSACKGEMMRLDKMKMVIIHSYTLVYDGAIRKLLAPRNPQACRPHKRALRRDELCNYQVSK